jgi:hypothetical protein
LPEGISQYAIHIWQFVEMDWETLASLFFASLLPPRLNFSPFKCQFWPS